MLSPRNWHEDWYLSALSALSAISFLLVVAFLASNNAASANTEWLAIWETKGSIGEDEPLHHASGFNGINLDQMNILISTIIKSEGRERFKPNNSVIDFGCGAGAFLQSLRLLHGSLRLYGIDYSG